MVGLRYDFDVDPQRDEPVKKRLVETDRSFYTCLGSLILFSLLVAIILLGLLLAKQQIPVQEPVKQHGNVLGTTGAHTGEKLSTTPEPEVRISKKLEKITDELNQVGTDDSSIPNIKIGESDFVDEDSSGEDSGDFNGTFVDYRPRAGTFDQDNKSPPICETEICKSEALVLSKLMDSSKPACIDFYSYACGNVQNLPQPKDGPELLFLKRLESASKNISADDLTSKGTWKRYLDSCIRFNAQEFDEKRDTILSLVQKHHGFSGNGPITEVANFTNVLARLMLYDVSPFFDVGIEPENEGSRPTFTLTLSPPSQHHLWPFFYNETGLTTDVAREKLNFTALDQENFRLMRMLFMSNYNKSNNLPSLDSFEKINSDIASKGSHSNEFVLATVADLQSQFPFLHWQDFLMTLSVKDVPEKMTIRVYDQNYFKKLSDDILLNQSLYSTVMLNILIHELRSRVVAESADSRTDYCLKFTSALLKDISSVIYRETFTNQEIEARNNLIMRVFNESRKNLMDEVERAPCLSDATRNILKEKLLHSSVVTGYDDVKFQTEKVLNSRLMNNRPQNDFIEDTLMWTQRGQELLYGLWGENAQRAQLRWLAPATAAAASPIFLYESNLVYVPMTYLGARFDEGLPNYLVESKLGFEISRALAGSIDFKGIHFNENNTFVETAVLDDEGMTVYKALQEHYSAVRVVTIANITTKVQISTKQSWKFRLTDDLAIRSAFAAGFSESSQIRHLPELSLTPKQLFFIKLAQQTCHVEPKIEYLKFLNKAKPLPHVYRLALMLPRFSEFSEAFNCPKEDGDEAPVLCLG